MNSDQKMASAVANFLSTIVAVSIVTTLQAYLLTLLLPWLFAGVSLGLGQAFIVVFFIRLFF